MKELSAQIREAVDSSGMSRYRICKEIEVAEATMSRFMSGKGGLSMSSIDRLGRLLGLAIVANTDPEKKGG